MKNLKIYYIIASAISIILVLLKLTGLVDIGWTWIICPLIAPFVATFFAVAFVMCAAICMAFLFLLFR
jgi:hypothetical protein